MSGLLPELPAVLDDALFHGHHLPSAGPHVDVVIESVELEVDGVESGLCAFLQLLVVLGEHDTVGGDLDLCELLLLGGRDDLHQLGVDGGLSSGELDRGTGDGLLVAEGVHHLADGLEVGLVDVSAVHGVGETDGTFHVASVGEIEVGEGGRGLHVESLAVDDDVDVLALCEGLVHGVEESGSVLGELLGLEVLLGVRPVDVGELSVLGAVLLHVDLSVLLEDGCLDGFAALGAERSGLLGKADCRRIRFYRCAHVSEKNLALYNI